MSGLQVTKEETIRAIRDELPQLLQNDPSLSAHVFAVAREHFPTRVEMEDRFTRTLNELARVREEQTRKWKEQRAQDNRKWEEQNRKWDEQRAQDNRKREEQTRKWEEQRAQDNRKWDEQNHKWEESNQKFEAVHREIIAQAKKHDRSIGALGSRWGLQTERAFRDALAGILVESFGVEVVNVNEFDDEGEVFGKPDQVELDIIVRNGLLIVCELKSSMDKSAMYTFERKVRFYEKHHQRKANRMIVISPMIEERARRVGKKLGIEMYADSLDVPVT
uniref:PD-(D/E)XK nuclease superfamily protein n=1 Tax=Candidatus Kentrum sp. UNK TaxID=2126344 RepID=A0A451B383_9GAMM|nr:MAG: hypothetical protein BECKUNK1418G_GA0071005_11471 [Candidatus Kentron sp. UNK]VFK72741.1 MAG: hypothetical protein BECKUNK1418H_GA0071006_11361 [Candidatus Kentron sp. UNK]